MKHKIFRDNVFTLNNRCKMLAAILICSGFTLLPASAFTETNLSAVNSVQQSKSTIKGVIKDASGEPVIGASILENGTNNGTISDFDGNFELQVPAGAILTISYIGYKNQEIKVIPGKPLNIILQEDSEALDEVVVIGYGTVKKRDLTGSVASVKSEDIVKIPTSNVMEAIQGQVAGFDITRSGGEVGSSMKMSLRGTRSIYGANDPLFIIDGMQGSFDELNPNDIASIEVLKDASSTAIYGSAGANGVVLITTKNPQKDKFSINFDAYFGWNHISKFPEMNTGDDYINFRREAARTQGLWNSSADDSSIFPSYMWNLIENDQWVNWFDLASQTGKTQSYNLTTSYANDRMNSYFSMGYYKIEGLLKGDEMERYSARTKVDFKANEYIKYGLNIYALYQNHEKRNSRIWNRIICTPPLGTPYDENGEVVLFPVGGDTGNQSPITDTGTGQYVHNIKSLSITPQIFVEITPVKNLSFRSMVGGYFKAQRTGIYEGNESFNGLATGSYASIPNMFTYNYKWENVLTYKFNLGEANEFTVTGATEWNKNRMEESLARANTFDSDSYLFHNLGAATGTPSVSSKYVGSQMMSYVARVNYSLLGRYLFTVSSRWDGSSMLASGNKWDVFPAGAVAWRVSDEAFMEKAKFVSNLKLRGSYGVTGNAGAEEYATLDYSRNGIFGFQDISIPFSGYSTNIANKNLGWEKSYMANIGIDLGFFDERISIVADWYETTTKNILFKKALPYATGGYASSNFTIWSNVGKTRNRGLELAINTRNIVKPKFQWNSSITFARNKEKVLKTTTDSPLQFGDYYLIPGEAIQTYYGYKYMGIWKSWEADEAAKYGQKPGSVHVLDADDNGVINADDYQVIGKATPDWTGSFSNTFRFYNFDLSVLLIARHGWTINYGLTGWYRANGLSPSPKICDYWTPENEYARFPRPDVNVAQTYDYQNSISFLDGSYVKVKNIALGYTMPKKVTDFAGISNMRVYFTANNPFIFTKSKYLKNYDPEKGGDDDDAPLSKQFVFGLNISF